KTLTDTESSSENEESVGDLLQKEQDEVEEEFDCPLSPVYILADLLSTNHHIEFNLNKESVRSILEEVIPKKKLNYSSVCGGYFTKLNGQITSPDIYIFPSSNYIATEKFLNTFLKKKFRSSPFQQLETIAPIGIIARKSIILSNGQNAEIYFTHINFHRNDNTKIQLMNTYDLQPCRIMYEYAKNKFYCSEWFARGGKMIYDERNPSQEFIQKYKTKGFVFEDNVYEPPNYDTKDINYI
ncbi:unnamed protein product, partial [Brachionus calyciflorus]